MSEIELIRAILWVLVTSHRYGSPMPRDEVLGRAAYASDRGSEARAAYETVRSQPFVLDYGSRGLQLDNSAFGPLVQFLYDECDWERFELELRIEHFEGWESIDWDVDAEGGKRGSERSSGTRFRPAPSRSRRFLSDRFAR